MKTLYVRNHPLCPNCEAVKARIGPDIEVLDTSTNTAAYDALVRITDSNLPPVPVLVDGDRVTVGTRAILATLGL